ncbi:MAG: GIY-YIG nuclease family protein [Alphaproteobacteria bacterium]|nr:GIY-YIG nuclease family protein [Alphaproteobacteria bacterium]
MGSTKDLDELGQMHPQKPGIYLVTLRNSEPISVNADRRRIADRCIKVNKLNCKVGRAVNLAVRFRNYQRTFGSHNVQKDNFEVLDVVESLAAIVPIEKEILSALADYRIRGLNGRLNEWLERIEPQQVKAIVCPILATFRRSDSASEKRKGALVNRQTENRGLESCDGQDPTKTILALNKLKKLGFTYSHFLKVHHFE